MSEARVQIVEDERIVALDLKTSLEALGFTVVGVCASEQDALETARTQSPDVVLMDINLGVGGDGTRAARRIHEELALPVIFLTAYAEQETLARAQQSLPYGYVLKPYELRELVATIRMALVRHASERARYRAEERLRLATEAAAIGVWEWDAANDRFEVEGPLEPLLGGEDGPLARGFEALVGRFHEAYREALRGLATDLDELHLRASMNDAEGETRNVELNARGWHDAAGGRRRIVAAMRDVTERTRDEQRLRMADVVYRTLSEGVAILDAHQHVQSVNPAFTRLTGFSLEDVKGLHPDRFLHQQAHGPGFWDAVRRAPERHWQGEVRCLTANGQSFPALQHVSAADDADAPDFHYVLSFSDISDLREAQAQLQHLAHHDPLTGLANRHFFVERLDSELQRVERYGGQLALMFIDLDGFKLVNDSLGHAEGDRLLRTIGNRLRQALRRSDLAARFGGDEFVVVVPMLEHVEDCATLAEKLLQAVSEPIPLSTQRVTVSASIGIAVFPENGKTPESLIQAADSAMYSAKSRGRSRYAFYSSGMARAAVERMRIEQCLRRAILEHSMRIQWQPLVALGSNRVTGFEALARWPASMPPAVDPDRFIAVAEDSGLIVPLGLQILHEACTQGAAWLAAGMQIDRIAVNVSARQLASGRFVQEVGAVLQDTGYPASRLELEITESTIQVIEDSQRQLDALKSLGVSLAIDDFGTGFSSLSLLKHLPIDRLKIDRSFVRDMPHDDNDIAIARAIIAMSHSLGLQITAEGIETETQARFLHELGCDGGQGFHFSRPLSAQDASSLVDRKGH
ncbi:EAL domain-containing protein [Caldimonas tepidiphila]|uniref:two-component system response regulator n=1 Tax=Caldimonas tepidiphila TaxID=2315841 RepID=UPI000E5A42AD|nr:EAL domain-containing protein [Caldimonas tepidiphila]